MRLERNQSRNKQKANTAVVLALVGGALALVVVVAIVAVVVYWRSTSQTGRTDQAGSGPQAAAGAVNRTPTRKQLFLDNAPLDDAARAEALQRVIEGNHDRCGSVDKAVMVSSGVWTVRCTPDGVFRVTFGRDGQIVSVQRL